MTLIRREADPDYRNSYISQRMLAEEMIRLDPTPIQPLTSKPYEARTLSTNTRAC